MEIPSTVIRYYESEENDRPRNTIRENIRLIVEFLGITAAIFALLFTIRTFGQMVIQADSANKQVGISRVQLEASTRPWIAPVPTQVGAEYLNYENGKTFFTLRVGLNNSGASPANVSVWLRSIFMDPNSKDMSEWIPGIDDSCREADRDLGKYPNAWLVIPDQVWPYTSRVEIADFKGSDAHPPRVLGCVAYISSDKSEAIRKIHHTGFSAFIMPLQKNRQWMEYHPVLFDKAYITPPGNLLLHKWDKPVGKTLMTVDVLTVGSFEDTQWSQPQSQPDKN